MGGGGGGGTSGWNQVPSGLVISKPPSTGVATWPKSAAVPILTPFT